MKVQVEKLKKEQDEIMRRLRGAEKKVDETDDENAETVYQTKMETLRKFHMRSGAPSPSLPQG
jgi:DNA-binding ferritin-like protein